MRPQEIFQDPGQNLGQAPGSAGLLLQAASLLAEEIREQALETPEGGIKWPTAAAFETASSPMPAGSPTADGFWDFYSGNPGIALFLAAYSRTTRDRTYRDLCLRALEPIREEIRRSRKAGPAPSPSLPSEIGALVGTSSWIYALLTAGRLLRDSKLLAEAHAASALITPERIRADGHHDLVFGSSGALLVLLALDHINPAPNASGSTPLELAELCARKLIATDLAGRMPPPGVPLRSSFGLSHGLAGTGLALSRFYGRTHDPEAGQAVRNVLAALIEFTAGEPPYPLRTPKPEAAEASWCHGAPGLSLALTGLLESDLDESARAAALQIRQQEIAWTQQAPFSPQDHLCCGNMGRVAVLAYVARKTQDPALLETACRLALLVLRVAKTRKGFTLDYDQPDASLFRGFAGIAYTLLALAQPGMPQVIALE